MRTRGLNSQRTEGKSTWPRDQNVQSHGIESGDKDAGQGAVRGQKWLLKAESSLGDAAWPTGGFYYCHLTEEETKHEFSELPHVTQLGRAGARIIQRTKL